MADERVGHAALERGEVVAGFRVTGVTPLPALRVVVVEAIHERTGLRLCHLVADDSENLISFAFRTPPPDDTGVPHILEHSVLGGSRKFPVKEPFLELLKMSMATFINAMTYPDKTVYPVASTVRQDFLNLADVYFDAVFHPNITPMTLKQEGHHLAFERAGDPDSPLVIKGIVYNEMRGAYSDVDSLIDRESMRGLFPDSPYGRDSGGDPDSIPSLTYSDFVGFYRRLYHPSNAFVFAYGDLPSEELLAFLDRRLADCPPAGDVDTVLARQPRWSEPVEARFPFPIARGESGERRGAVTLNWLVGDTLDVMGDLAMSMVDVLLLGSSAAPLRRALVDSQLGDDLTSSGYNSGILEPTFHVGLKGIDLERSSRWPTPTVRSRACTLCD
jgi:Zn-dependent M16 (insulinase) family peptidase